MALQAPDKDQLMRFTQAAKKIIYDAGRMKQFMQMMGTKEGALQAVHTVLAIIGKYRQIPENLVPLLGVNCYMLMVDVAQEATKHKADPAILRAVIQSILSSTQQNAAQPSAQSAPVAQSGGIIGRQMQGVPA